MNAPNPLQQCIHSTGTMLMQCRFVVVLLTLFLFITFASYATLPLISESLEKRVAIAFSAGIFLKPGTIRKKQPWKEPAQYPELEISYFWNLQQHPA